MYIHTYVCMYIHTCMCICIHVYITYLYICKHLDAAISIQMFVYMCAYV